MDNRLLAPWKKLNQHTDIIFAELAKYPEDILQKQPNAGTWSASQNIVHLINAERKSLAYLQKKMSFAGSDTVPEKIGARNFFRFALLRTVLALPAIKFKSPATIEPIEVKNLKDLKADMAALRKEYDTFLSNLSTQWIESALWKHPLAGKLSVRQMLVFFTLHVDRHSRQIERTLKLLEK